MRRWQQAKEGEGTVVLISGEPGIGKSRIAQTIVDRLGGEPHTRLRYFCSLHHQDTALYPSITQLERAAGFRREDTPDQRLDRLEAVLAEATNDLTEAIPLLAELLCIPTGDRYPALNLTPQKRKEKTLHVQLAQVEGLAARQPVLMVFEDVHWSDPTTRESLDRVVDRVPALRVLVIITFRPEFSPPWIGRPHVTMLTLNRLPPRQRANMIRGLIGGKALPKEITDQIIDRTDGVPLFIEELTKSVVESGLLTEAGDQYQVMGPLIPLAIPTSLHASLLARLDRLAPVREVAQIAAALGRQFSHELVSAAAGMPQRRLNNALDQLVSSELIFRRGTPPDAEYTFKHALVQDATYSTLLKSRRQQIHARIATTLEEKFPDIVTTQPAILAHHCGEAGLIEKAVGYWLKAGQQSVARWALNEATMQLRTAITLLPSLPDPAERQKQELKLQLALAHALLARKGEADPEPEQAYARARQLCEQLNQPQHLPPILFGQFSAHLLRGDLQQAESHAKELACLSESLNDVMWKCGASTLNGIIYFWLGKFIDASRHLEHVLSLWDASFRELAWKPQDTYVVSLGYLARTLQCLGYFNQARWRCDEALAEARRVSPYALAFALAQALGVDRFQGVKSAQAMLGSANELFTLSQEHGFPLFCAIGTIQRGWCLSALGQATEGISVLTKGIADCRATGSNVLIPSFLTSLAEVYGITDQPEEGLKQLDEAANLVETTQERWAEAEMNRIRGTLLLSMNDPAAAEDSYLRALAVAQAQSAKLWQLRATLDLARLWRDQGKRAEAHDLLAPVYNWFTEGFDTPVLQDAKALLDQLT